MNEFRKKKINRDYFYFQLFVLFYFFLKMFQHQETFIQIFLSKGHPLKNKERKKE